MVNDADKPVSKGHAGIPNERRLARTSLVNSGQDTQLTLRDGSTIVLKGVTRLDAVFPASAAAAKSKPSPIGGEIGGDGEDAHRRGNDREGARGVGE